MCSLKFESIAIRFPFNTRMSVAHKWEVEQTVCGREVVRHRALSWELWGLVLRPPQGRVRNLGIPSPKSLVLPYVSQSVDIWGAPMVRYALYQEVQELKTLKLPSGSLWAAEKSLMRREAKTQILREAYGQRRSCWRSQITFSWRDLGKTSERRQNLMLALKNG